MSQILIDDKAIAIEAAKSAKKICEPGCIGNYETCNMCFEKDVFGELLRKLPKVGKDNTCPLAKYGVKEKDVKTDMLSRIKNTPREMDCINLCANCQYGSLNADGLMNGYYQIDRSDEDYKSHCLDCPVQSIFDSIAETRAEANAER